MEQMRPLLDRLECWLAQHRPHYLDGLYPGVSREELADFARDLGVRVPRSLRSLLAWHNGQRADFIGCFEESWKLMSTQAIVTAKGDLDDRDAATGWQTAWLPFLENDAGDFLCLDTRLARAPVRAFWLGRTEHPVVAFGLPAWMRRFVDAVEEGEYLEDPERGYFLRRQAGGTDSLPGASKS